MPNPAGTNNLVPEVPYGDVKRMNELTRQAPVSGAAVAGRALNTPKRLGEAARRPQAPQQAPPQGQALPVSPPPAPPSWQQIAAIPGASHLVLELAARAGGA